MRTIRRRLSYANVVSTLALFLVLTGGAAYAAHKLTRRSVGTPQLKSNAVTTAKIKANAVTTRKIKRIAVSSAKLKEGAVTTEKLFDGAVTSDKIDLEDVPFARVAARLRGAGSLVLKPGPGFQVYPLDSSAYTQAANELDSYAGAVSVTIPAKCTAPRVVFAKVLVDAEDPTKPAESEVVAVGKLVDEGVGALNTTVELSPDPEQSVKFEPGTATKHTVDLILEAGCGGGSGVTATSGAVDVIATR
jgi:hypothetical protein